MKKMNLTISKLMKVTSFIFLTFLTLNIVSCADNGDTTPEPDPIPVATDEMYLKVNGLKVICKIPANEYAIWINNGDTGVRWEGNLPNGDTMISIGHWGPKLKGFKYKFDPKALGDDIVAASIRYSSLSTAPYVVLDGGDYTLEKIKGKWVSTLKNGIGYDANNKTKRYTGVEFRIIWP